MTNLCLCIFHKIPLFFQGFFPLLPCTSDLKWQVSYLCKERNYAPWVQATDALDRFISRLDPTDDAKDVKDLKERKEVWKKVKKWVANLVMPYFKETGGFRFSGQLTEEEKHLKVHMIKFACDQLELKQCLNSCQEQFAEYLAGKQIDSYLLTTIKKFGQSPLWTNAEPVCDNMLNETQYDFNAEEGLKYLETCWERLNKVPRREMLLGKLVSKVELEKDVERLRKWWESISQGQRKFRSALKDHKWAASIFKKVEARAKSRSDCEPMLHETIKQVFK